MAANQLETRVQHLPGVAIIELHGEINAFAEQALNAAYGDACMASPGAILLDFSGVDYINSTGIALIVSLMSKARQANCRLMACGLSDHYQEIFTITRLSDFMNIYPDRAAALKTVQATAA
ncbi:MAG: STAS domain-containing protein [Acidobacteriota bacterium]